MKKLKKQQTDSVLGRGVEHRKAVARTQLGLWDASLRRKDPFRLLASAMRGRVPSLLALKRERMTLSPFVFFRGAAPIMAYDLSLVPHTEILCQLCGDAHVQNLGAFEGDDGRLIFDINDFDETIRGPFEWDVKRMATSILLAGQDAKCSDGGCTNAVEAFLTSYCSLMARLSQLPLLQVARFQVHRLESLSSISEILRKAERATPLHTRDALLQKSKDGRIFRDEPPLLHRVTGKQRVAVLRSLGRYRATLQPARQHLFEQFRPMDVCFKVVGTGSVGMRDYIVYLEGNGPDDPLFLQIKEETHSVYEAYLPAGSVTEPNQGQRVINGHRALQLQSDPLLGYTRFDGRDYVVRQLNDHKATLDVTTLNQAGLQQYAEVCGEMLARGHARSGDARMIRGYIGKGGRFGDSILKFARSYATQTHKDWQAFKAQSHS